MSSYSKAGNLWGCSLVSEMKAKGGLRMSRGGGGNLDELLIVLLVIALAVVVVFAIEEIA
jgi:hypothetical protein